MPKSDDMKLTLWILLYAFSPLSLAKGPVVWIVGEGFIGRTDLVSAVVNQTKISPSSWALDRNGCRLWVSDEKTGQLARLSPDGSTLTAPDNVSRILSDPDKNGQFLTRSPGGSRVEQRDASGSLVSQSEHRWVENSEHVVRHQNFSYSLNASEETRKLLITRLDATLTEVGQSLVSKRLSPWGERRLALDPLGGLWVGFTAPGLKSSVAWAERWSFEGRRETQHAWPERGLLFDLCAEPDGSVLVARDIPSDSGFTVPFYSYLERVKRDGSTQTYYQTDVNYFIDSVACHAESVWMVQRSIFGSDGSYLVRWNPKAGGLGDSLFRLHNKVKKLYFCES